MYTGEYAWLLVKNGEMDKDRAFNLSGILGRCFKEPGLLMRSPENAGGQEGPDDYLGVCLGIKAIQTQYDGVDGGNKIFKYGLKHFGVFRNDPGASIWQAFLWRQPQLIAAALSIVQTHWYSSLLYFLIQRPFMWYAAGSIFFACRGNVDGMDPWRLTWILIQLTEDKSWLCKWAAQGWYDRLWLKFCRDGMNAVAADYYEPEHPFALYHERGDRTYFGVQP
jgi:hypothetical protein